MEFPKFHNHEVAPTEVSVKLIVVGVQAVVALAVKEAVCPFNRCTKPVNPKNRTIKNNLAIASITEENPFSANGLE